MLTLDRMRLAKDAERGLVVHVPATHLVFVREGREEQEWERPKEAEAL